MKKGLAFFMIFVFFLLNSFVSAGEHVTDLWGSFETDRIILNWQNGVWVQTAGLRIYRMEQYKEAEILTNLSFSDSSFIDTDVNGFTSYTYTVVTLDSTNGEIQSSREVEVARFPGSRNDLIRFSENSLSLSGVAPVLFYYSVEEVGPVHCTILDLNRRIVRSLVEGESGTGTFEMTWDGSADSGSSVSPGIYFLVLKTPAGREIRKCVVRE